MDIQEFGKRMKFDDDTLKKFEPGWQELLEHSSDSLPDFMRKEFYTKYYPLCKGPENSLIFPAMEKVERILESNPAAARYAWMLHYALLLAPKNIHNMPWREPVEVFGKNSGIFLLMIALSALPLVRKKHEELNLPEKYMHGIAEWIGGTIGIYAAAHNGQPGHTITQTYWLRYSINGELFRIGRLEFLPGVWNPELPAVYRNRNDRSLAVLCQDGWAFDKEGFRVDPEQKTPAFTAKLIFMDDSITGTPISPYGFPVPEQTVTLNRKDWEPVCAPWEKNLTIHIPGGGGITTEALYQSLRDAKEFYKKYFGEDYKVFTCMSWLFNPAWEKELPESNIAKWQKQVYLTPPLPPAGMPGYFFVYGTVNGDPRSQPVTSSLHKAFCNIIERGEPLRWGGMFFMAEDIEEYGTEYYRKQWKMSEK